MSIYSTIFTVLPFAISTTTSPFTKMFRLLMKYRRLKALRIAYFLADVGNIKSDLRSKFLLNTPIRIGFFRNKEKSVWKPVKNFPWLGISVSLIKRCLYVSKDCISNLPRTIKYITNNPYTSAWH